MVHVGYLGKDILERICMLADLAYFVIYGVGGSSDSGSHGISLVIYNVFLISRRIEGVHDEEFEGK